MRHGPVNQGAAMPSPPLPSAFTSWASVGTLFPWPHVPCVSVCPTGPWVSGEQGLFTLLAAAEPAGTQWRSPSPWVPSAMLISQGASSMPTAHSPEGFRIQKLTVVRILNLPKIGGKGEVIFLKLCFLIVHTPRVSSWTLCFPGTRVCGR